jgi:hypothetical protein
LTAAEAHPIVHAVDREALKQVVREVLEEEHGFGYTPIASRYSGGRLIMEPRDASLQPKEIPIDTFFHKIVMVRDRLRVLEQKVNASKIEEKDKIDLQQYITKVYGSLTTFNALFKHTEDGFSGSSE